jgi:hypothetical protein
VRYSLAPKAFLALTLALTLFFKVVVHDTAGDNAYLSTQDSLISFLTRHQFQSHSAADTGRIYAGSGDCHLAIARVIPQGYNLDAIKTVFAREGRLSFVFEGRVYGEWPPTTTTLSHYWTRLQQQLGLNAGKKPILAVASSESCAVDALPWKEIAELP